MNNEQKPVPLLSADTARVTRIVLCAYGCEDGSLMEPLDAIASGHAQVVPRITREGLWDALGYKPTEDVRAARECNLCFNDVIAALKRLGIEVAP